MKATEGTWLDFDGNIFGQGNGADYIQEPGRYHSWRRWSLEPAGGLENEDYAVLLFDQHGNDNGLWLDHYSDHQTYLVCQKPIGMIFNTICTVFSRYITST